MPRMRQVEAVRLDDLLRSDIALVGWEEGEPELVGGSDGGEILGPKLDAIYIPLTRDGDGALRVRSLGLTERERLGWLVGEEALPLGEGGTGLMGIVPLAKDGCWGRKRTAVILDPLLESTGMFRLTQLL